MTDYNAHNKNIGEESASQTSVLMSLALFIILLAFFIVLNAVSQYSEPKVNQVFDSIDLAFDKNIIPTDFENETLDDRSENQDGQGDSVEDIQDVLRSVLPGLDVNLTSNPNGGKIMAIRIKKDHFEKLSSRLIPVFVRILNIKDGAQDYNLALTSYVRSPLSSRAEQSYEIIELYKDKTIEMGVIENRLSLSIEQGNPAFLMFRFDKVKQ